MCIHSNIRTSDRFVCLTGHASSSVWVAGPQHVCMAHHDAPYNGRLSLPIILPVSTSGPLLQSPESQFKVREIFPEFPVQWHLLWCIQWGHCLIYLLCAYVRFCYGYPNASSSTEEAKSYQNIHPQGDEGDEAVVAVLTREQTFIFQTWSPYWLYNNTREPWAAWRSPNWAVFIQLRRGKEKWKIKLMLSDFDPRRRSVHARQHWHLIKCSNKENILELQKQVNYFFGNNCVTVIVMQ